MWGMGPGPSSRGEGQAWTEEWALTGAFPCCSQWKEGAARSFSALLWWPPGLGPLAPQHCPGPRGFERAFQAAIYFSSVIPKGKGHRY